MSRFEIADIGNISVHFDGLGPLDWILDVVVNLVANLIKDWIADLVEGPLKDIIQGVLNDIVPDIPGLIKL